MSRITHKKFICILLILSTTLLINVKNSFVLCDDNETACPSNYICCKRDRGYYCCYKTMICCNKGQSCCETNYFGGLKKNPEKPKISLSLSLMRNQLDNNTLNVNPKENIGLVEKINEVLVNIKQYINKNLRHRGPLDLKTINEIIESIKNSVNDYFVDKIFEGNRNTFEELEIIVNEFFDEFKGSQIYEKLVDLLSKILKYINS